MGRRNAVHFLFGILKATTSNSVRFILYALSLGNALPDIVWRAIDISNNISNTAWLRR